MLKKSLPILLVLSSALSANCTIDEMIQLKQSGFAAHEVKDICEKKNISTNNSVTENVSIQSQTQAVDTNYREGLYAALGFGYHSLSYESDGFESEEYNGLTTSFNIGYGFTNNFLLFYSNDINWYTREEENSYYSDDEEHLIINGLSGLGLTYFLSENFYTTLVYGIASDKDLSSEDDISYSGIGYEIGIGYEFAKRWSAEFIYASSTFDTEETSSGEFDVDFTSTSMHFGLKYSWY